MSPAGWVVRQALMEKKATEAQEVAVMITEGLGRVEAMVSLEWQ